MTDTATRAPDVSVLFASWDRSLTERCHGFLLGVETGWTRALRQQAALLRAERDNFNHALAFARSAHAWRNT